VKRQTNGAGLFKKLEWEKESDAEDQRTGGIGKTQLRQFFSCCDSQESGLKAESGPEAIQLKMDLLLFV